MEDDLNNFGERLLHLSINSLNAFGTGSPGITAISAGNGSVISGTTILLDLQHAGARFIQAAKGGDAEQLALQANRIEAGLNSLLVINQLQQHDFDSLYDQLQVLKNHFYT